MMVTPMRFLILTFSLSHVGGGRRRRKRGGEGRKIRQKGGGGGAIWATRTQHRQSLNQVMFETFSRKIVVFFLIELDRNYVGRN